MAVGLAQVRARLDQEVKIAVQLEHKNIATTYGLFGASLGNDPIAYLASESIDGQSLREMIDKTLFAVSTDETRFNLSGVFIESGDGIVRMVATDGHRLAMIERTLKAPALPKGVIMPRKGLAEARKLLEAVAQHVPAAPPSSSGGTEEFEVELDIDIEEEDQPDTMELTGKIKVSHGASDGSAELHGWIAKSTTRAGSRLTPSRVAASASAIRRNSAGSAAIAVPPS